MHTIMPWLVRIEQAIIKDVLIEEEQESYFPKFNVDGLMRGDYKSRMDGYAVGFANGFLSPNDIRRLENMDLIPAEEGGDDYYLNGSYTKLKDAGSAYGANQVAEQEKQQSQETKEPDETQPEEGEEFVCNETLLLQLMKLKDGNGNYIWKPGLDTAKPDTILGRPIRTSTFMPTMSAGERVLLFGDLKNYWVADRQNRTFRRLNELYARTDQVGFLTTQRVDGRLILPESVKVLKMAGIKPAPAPTPDPDEQANG